MGLFAKEMSLPVRDGSCNIPGYPSRKVCRSVSIGRGGLRLQFVCFFYTKAKALPAAGSFALELDGRRDACGSYFFPLPPALGRCFVSESDAPFLMLDGELR